MIKLKTNKNIMEKPRKYNGKAKKNIRNQKNRNQIEKNNI
jgi:hypothetical protein